MEANNAHFPPKVNNKNYQDIPDVPPLPDLHHFQQTQEWTHFGADDNLSIDVRDASAMTTGNSGGSVSSTIAKTELMIQKIRISYMNKCIQEKKAFILLSNKDKLYQKIGAIIFHLSQIEDNQNSEERKSR